MKRFFLLLASLVLFLLKSACAQPPSTQPIESTALKASSLTANDTIIAIQEVFKQRRRTGGFLLGTSALAVVGSSVGAHSEGGFINDYPFLFLFYGLLTSPAWLIGIGKAAKFSASQERAIIAQYKQTHQLSPFMHKIITKGHFNNQSKFIPFQRTSNSR